VNYPAPSFKIKQENEQHFVFDAIRKTWLVLTEEEWVRQNFIQYLVTELHYPATLIAIEKELELNGLKKRFDVLVYNQQHQPLMLIECKAPQLVLNDAALEQLLRYHISIPVPFLIITNGKTTYGWEKIGNELKLLDKLPDWPSR
jgi:hypothetical protein